MRLVEWMWGELGGRYFRGAKGDFGVSWVGATFAERKATWGEPGWMRTLRAKGDFGLSLDVWLLRLAKFAFDHHGWHLAIKVAFTYLPKDVAQSHDGRLLISIDCSQSFLVRDVSCLRSPQTNSNGFRI